MTVRIDPATAARFDDAATILAPKRAGAQGCWCLSYRLPPAQNDALRAPHRGEELRRLCGRPTHAPGVLAYDGDDGLAILSSNEWRLSRIIEEWPLITFHATREIR